MLCIFLSAKSTLHCIGVSSALRPGGRRLEDNNSWRCTWVIKALCHMSQQLKRHPLLLTSKKRVRLHSVDLPSLLQMITERLYCTTFRRTPAAPPQIVSGWHLVTPGQSFQVHIHPQCMFNTFVLCLWSCTPMLLKTDSNHIWNPCLYIWSISSYCTHCI